MKKELDRFDKMIKKHNDKFGDKTLEKENEEAKTVDLVYKAHFD